MKDNSSELFEKLAFLNNAADFQVRFPKKHFILIFCNLEEMSNLKDAVKLFSINHAVK